MKRLNYVESTGAQHVDTGLAFNSSTDEVRVSCQLVGTTAYRYCFGVFQTGSYLGVCRDNSNAYLVYGTQDAIKALSYITGSRHEVVADSNGLGIDGTNMVSFRAFASTAPVYLFNLNRPGNTNNYKSASRLWGYRHWRNGALVRDFVPALDDAGVACLFDTVSLTPFYSATATPLVAGTEYAGGGYYGSPSRIRPMGGSWKWWR